MSFSENVLISGDGSGENFTKIVHAVNAVLVGGTKATGKVPQVQGDGTTVEWDTITGTLEYQGTWDADTNTPALASGVGTKGYYYVVSVAGTTNLDGVAVWDIGDWAIYSGTAWQKLDQTNTVDTVFSRTGDVTAAASDYDASQVDNDSGVTGAFVSDALDTLAGAAPNAHAASHTDGTDDIQSATAAQKGVATAAQITKLDGIEALAEVNNISDVNATDLTDAGETSLHTHPAAAPAAHAASHTDGTDDIQDATAAQKGVATAAQITKLDGIEALAEVNVVDSVHGRTGVVVAATDDYTLGQVGGGVTEDSVVTTDATGNLQESGAKVETGPTGGSLINLVEYASTPTGIEAGDLWVQAKDATTKTLNFYNGTSTFSVDLSV